MNQLANLNERLTQLLPTEAKQISIENAELTIVVPSEAILTVCQLLRDHTELQFNQLIDLCGVDYQQYGKSEWETEAATSDGFSRGVEPMQYEATALTTPSRFAVVYHLLSYAHNQRIRIKTWLNDEFPKLASVIEIWPSANWYEREAFDLFGILFEGHPDLRRILTDYGFIGHPFRKDFPLIGEVEMRYDAALARVVYEPVSIAPRTLVPKVIRDDNRYNPNGINSVSPLQP